MVQHEQENGNDREEEEKGGWKEVVSPSSSRRRRRNKAVRYQPKKEKNQTHTSSIVAAAPTAHPITDTNTDSTNNNPIIDNRQQRQKKRLQQQPQQPPSMIILVGVPGSGKSTFAQTLQTHQPDRYVRVNQDTLKTRSRCQSAARSALAQGKTPVIDRCNFDPEQRLTFRNLIVVDDDAASSDDNNNRAAVMSSTMIGVSETGIGNGDDNGNGNGNDGHTNNHHHKEESTVSSSSVVDCIVFDCPTEECVQRCMERKGHPSIHKGNARVVVNKMARLLKIPTVGDDEGYRSVRRVRDVGGADRLVKEYLDGWV